MKNALAYTTMILVWLLVLLAACAPGAENPATATPEPVCCAPVETVAALSPVTPYAEQYPAAEATASGAYPEPQAPATLPPGYPEVTVVAPGGEIDEIILGNGSSEADNSLGTQLNVTPPSPELSALYSAVAMALSRETDVPVDEISLVSAAPMTWPNAGLGCPDPERMYAEVLVDGLLVKMQAGNRTFDVHTNGLQAFVLCRDGQPIATGEVP